MSRHPAGPRIHRARPDREVRGLLSRARGFAAGEGRLGRGDARNRRHRGRPARPFATPPSPCPTTIAGVVEDAFRAHGDNIAAVIVEPVAGNMGCVPPRAGLPASAARNHGAPRRAADLRRGDDRLPRGVRRRAAALRRAPGPDHARQSDRRRAAGGGLRRPQGHHEPGSAVRAGVPGGNALRQPAGGGRGPGHAPPSESASGNLRPASKRAPQRCAPPPRPASR